MLKLKTLSGGTVLQMVVSRVARVTLVLGFVSGVALMFEKCEVSHARRFLLLNAGTLGIEETQDEDASPEGQREADAAG